jgi:hypothetical protein
LPLWPEKVAGFGFLFFYPWAWLLNHDWFKYQGPLPLAQLIISYAIFVWIPAILYSACVRLVFRFLPSTLGRIRRKLS